MRFTQLVDATLDCAEKWGWQALRVDGSFSRLSRSLPSGELVLQTWRMGRRGRGELRMAQIESAKIHVVTCFLYPDPQFASPLYAMELVEIGHRPVVAVLDMVAPSADPARQWAGDWLGSAHARTPDLVNSDDVPEWYADCRSGSDFFLRPRCPRETDRVAVLHLAGVESIVTNEATPTRSESQQRAWKAFEDSYKSHHAENSPGLPLMQKSFGLEWTERYMKTCFFA